MHVRKIRESLRWRGPWIACLLFLRELFKPVLYWYVLNIYETDISAEISQPYSRESAEVTTYTAADDVSTIQPSLNSINALSTAQLALRFQRGDAVVVASFSGRPVGYMWLAFATGIELEFGTCWIIRGGEALRYDSFVIPSCRGRGVHSILNAAANAYARERGAIRTLGSTSALNPQSLSLPKHYNRAIAMTLLLVRFRFRSFTIRKSFRAPLTSRFSWPGSNNLSA